MTLVSREHLPKLVQRAVEQGTRLGAGGRPEYGVLGEALSHVEVVLQDLGMLPPVLGNPSAVTDGYRIYLDPAAMSTPQWGRRRVVEGHRVAPGRTIR